MSTLAPEMMEGSATRKDLTAKELAAECELYMEWIERSAGVCEVAARGNLEVRLLGCENGGAIERLVRSINYLLDVTDAFVRESGAALAAAADQRFYRKIILQGLLGPFRLASETINEATERMEVQTMALAESEVERAALAESVDLVATSVQDSAKSVQATAKGLKQSAASTAAQAATVAAAAEETSAIVQTVAAATEELSVTAAEIERHMREMARIANDAVDGANKTTVTVQGLAAAQNKIGVVVKTISQVASQTNLLALNATIESARAGEAGKGFAVVASEVKSLSRQTAVATESIENEIESIHTAASASASAIDEISKTIRSLDDVSKTVMIAVDEQRSATREISQSIQQAAAATTDVTKSIIGVNDAAQNTSTAIDDLQSAADDLTQNSDSLKRSMQQLLNRQNRSEGRGR
ncbi:MAG: methyl-accepting chemotaxis protein [Acidobacteriaceae bacterium]